VIPGWAAVFVDQPEPAFVRGTLHGLEVLGDRELALELAAFPTWRQEQGLRPERRRARGRSRQDLSEIHRIAPPRANSSTSQ
jgi:hypothetical protein